ncbi:hypothetical protein H3S75_13320 [Gilliamella sp. B14384G15]|uniref:esterase/lipase family protein n=1 Tax=unclassified Gilliamella TaxID=2685620 RepID=UPI0018DDC6FF|nr:MULTISPECIES: hypothetical protein [unclassified Gilliamella]MBI0032215.1 hypothetical protein [Gilliamella sp. B14384G15]MBI0059503.1 hypothetical protein [Gilliamella sp. B14384G12]
MDNNCQSEIFNTRPRSNEDVVQMHIEKERKVIPIILLPGVMGSNLKLKSVNGDNNSRKVWRIDTPLNMTKWLLPILGNAKRRKCLLDPKKTEVDDRGRVIEAASKEISSLQFTYNQRSNDEESSIDLDEEGKKADENHPENKLFGTRRERGWGTVGYFSYGVFLDTFQSWLYQPTGELSLKLQSLTEAHSFKLASTEKTTLKFDGDDIKKLENYDFPLYAMGYNWLESNEKSARRLQKLVEETIPAFYKKKGRVCDKVILMTHSMGGLVARYYTEALGGREKVYGVINAVQPSIGAAAAYTRMKCGNQKNFFIDNVLGKDGAEMTAVLAQAPGPLQLLPGIEYGKKWLTISPPLGGGDKEQYPKTDPYKEIYLNKEKWWCVCEPHLINPFNKKHNKEIMESDWKQYENIINNDVKKFHEKISGKYHPNTYAFYGVDVDAVDAEKRNEKKEEKDREPIIIAEEFLTYDEVNWNGEYKKIDFESGIKRPSDQYIGDKNRLNLREKRAKRTIAIETKKREKGESEAESNQQGNIDFQVTYNAECYTLEPAKGNGDGTVSRRSGEIDPTKGNGDGMVPQCSGEIPKKTKESLRALTYLAVGHESAYKKSEEARDFALRAIVDIIVKIVTVEENGQQVKT